jgi:hypothetical protein
MDTSGVSRIDECVAELLSEPASSVRMLVDDAALLRAVVRVCRDGDVDTPRVDLLCTSDALGGLEREFVVGAEASELVADGVVSIRSRADEGPDLPALVFRDAAVTALVPVGGSEVVATPVTDDGARDRLQELYRSLWETAVPHTIDLPPYSTMLSVADRTVGRAVREDFAAAAEALDSRNSGASVKPVALAILVGARHEAFVADITEWAEAIGLATQGTVSKVKTELEDLDVVTTDDVAHGVGRPRQQLRFADDSFTTLTVEELIAAVQPVI